MTAADRPSVTDNARAEAERRYPSDVADRGLTYPTGAVREHSQAAFVAGAEWAAGHAETTAEATERIARQIAASTAMTGTDAREYVEAVQALQHAETTTATTEDAADHLIAHQPTYSNTHLRYICRCGDESHWPTHAAQALADAGLLATARTRPTREQIARALDRAGAFCGECGAEPGDFFDSCLECQRWLLNYADAVLALLGGDDRG